METGWDHGRQHDHDHGMVGTIGHYVAPILLTIGSNQPLFFFHHTQASAFCQRFPCYKSKDEQIKGRNRPFKEEPKEEAYPGD
jgi:hypothetical protein